MTSNPYRRPSWIPPQACLVLHLIASAWYVWTGPSGFAFLSRSFVEHQAIAPAMVALSVVALVGAWRPRPALIAGGAILGFWMVVLPVMAATGSTGFAGSLWTVFLCLAAAFVFCLHGVRNAGLSPGFLFAGDAAGLVLGLAFLACTWAPPATTAPRNVAAPHPPTTPSPAFVTDVARYRVSIDGRALLIESPIHREHLVVYPALEFPSASDGGWSIFQFRQVRLPPWSTGRDGERRTWFRAEGEEAEAWGWVEVEGGRVRIHCATRLKREIPAHLASAVRVVLPGAVTIEGEPWPEWDGRASFLAIRDGRLELVRSARREKGPYTTLAHWPVHDPVLWTDTWSVHVRGWAEQGSRAESPTAGWGISQATVERSGSEFYWGLASTSAGRGWHAVRTREGTYVFEIEIVAR